MEIMNLITPEAVIPRLHATSKKQALQEIVSGLLRETHASRTTLRLDLHELGIGVDDPVAEACMPGVRPLTGETSIDQRNLNTVRWIEKHGVCLVQESCREADPAPPQALMDVYGVEAQMLGPVVRNGRLMAWLSVHENRSSRKWTEDEIAALQAAVARVHEVLDRVQLGSAT
jgi:maleate isomerase